MPPPELARTHAQTDGQPENIMPAAPRNGRTLCGLTFSSYTMPANYASGVKSVIADFILYFSRI